MFLCFLTPPVFIYILWFLWDPDAGITSRNSFRTYWNWTINYHKIRNRNSVNAPKKTSYIALKYILKNNSSSCFSRLGRLRICRTFLQTQHEAPGQTHVAAEVLLSLARGRTPPGITLRLSPNLDPSSSELSSKDVPHLHTPFFWPQISSASLFWQTPFS